VLNDQGRPLPAILSPIANSRIIFGTQQTNGPIVVTAPDLVLSGTAVDDGLITNVSLSQVYFDSNGARHTNDPVSVPLSGSLPGRKTWTNTFTLADGTNIFYAVASDSAGNTNMVTVSKTYFLVHTAALTVNNMGNGEHAPADALSLQVLFGAATNGASLEIGRNYKIKAIPGPNTIFTNWTDGDSVVRTNGNNFTTVPILVFRMNAGLVLNANFLTNPIVAGGAAGLYNGLFAEAAGVTEESAGFMSSLLVRTNLAYSGRIVLGGKFYSVSGLFDTSGNSTRSVLRTVYGLSNLTVTLHLDWAGGTRQMTGSIISTNSLGAQWNAAVTNDLAGLYTGHGARFTIAIPPATNSPLLSPGGYGYLLSTNTPSGFMTLSGKTADGALLAQTVSVSKDGKVPLYVNMYGGSGMLHGWLDISSGTPQGEVNWLKTVPTVTLVPTNYPNGFTNLLVTILGSPYDPNGYSGGRALGMTSGTFKVSDCNVGTATNLTWNVSLNSLNAITRTAGEATNSLSGSITKSLGLFAVKFRPSNAGPVSASNPDRIVTGVVLQNRTNALGAFNGNDGRTGTGELDHP
jgi:hypothetical protein